MSTTDQLLRELVKLARVQVYPVARALLEDEFFKDGEPMLDRVRVYAALDGSKTQTAVAESAGVGQASVSRWKVQWQRKGLVDDDGVATFNIYDFFPDLEG